MPYQQVNSRTSLYHHDRSPAADLQASTRASHSRRKYQLLPRPACIQYLWVKVPIPGHISHLDAKPDYHISNSLIQHQHQPDHTEKLQGNMKSFPHAYNPVLTWDSRRDHYRHATLIRADSCVYSPYATNHPSGAYNSAPDARNRQRATIRSLPEEPFGFSRPGGG